MTDNTGPTPPMFPSPSWDDAWYTRTEILAEILHVADWMGVPLLGVAQDPVTGKQVAA